MLAEYFQIRDDLLNIANEEYQQSKIYCEDLTEGKFSFPKIIYAIKKDQNDTRLNILRQRTDDEKIKAHAVKYMTDVELTRYIATSSRAKGSAETEIDRLGSHSSGCLVSEVGREDPTILIVL